MKGMRGIAASLCMAIALVGLSSCADSGQLTDVAGSEGTLEVSTPAFASTGGGAVTGSGTFRGPFPPNPAVPFVPVPAPCLGLGEPLHMSGTWSGWFRTTLTPTGRLHITEQIDWREITLTLGDLTWLTAPAAYEPIVLILPATVDDLGEAAFVVRHQFTVRFISQNGLPDLRVTHSVKQVLGPDGQFRHNEFVPFTAECIGGG